LLKGRRLTLPKGKKLRLRVEVDDRTRRQIQRKQDKHVMHSASNESSKMPLW
jgi:hypothetical protein